MITTNYFKKLLPEIVHLISGKLPLCSALAFSACCKRLSKLAGRHFWEDMCKEYHVHLDGRNSPRFQFIVELNDRNPSKLLKFGNFLFYHVGDIKLAETYFVIARERCTSSFRSSFSLELTNSINDQINRIHYLYYEKNTHTKKFFSSTSNCLFPLNENTNKETDELKILKVIKQFRRDILLSLKPGHWEKYDDLNVTNLAQIFPEVALEAISFYCYSWAARKQSTNGEEIFNKLIGTPNLPYSIKKRIQILMALRQFNYGDGNLTNSEAANILKAVCKNENICLTERMLARYTLISAKCFELIEDEIFTFEESFELAKEVDSCTFQIHEIPRFYLMLISQTKFDEHNCITQELIRRCSMLAYRYGEILPKVLLYYCQLAEIKRYYTGLDTNCCFEEISCTLNIISQNPPTYAYGIIKAHRIISETNDLLSKWTTLKSMNFDKLRITNQKKILASEITDSDELLQAINLLFAKDHFIYFNHSPFNDEEVIEMLNKIVETPLDRDEKMKLRWENRYGIALQLLKNTLQ